MPEPKTEAPALAPQWEWLGTSEGFAAFRSVQADPASVAWELHRLRSALRVIAGEQPCADNLLGNADIARIALHGR